MQIFSEMAFSLSNAFLNTPFFMNSLSKTESQKSGRLPSRVLDIYVHFAPTDPPSSLTVSAALPLQVHHEFVRNVENTSVEGLIQKLSESKGTGKERPGKLTPPALTSSKQQQQRRQTKP